MLIGRELENPFGTDITDIDMDLYIRQLKVEVNIITSKPSPTEADFVTIEDNMPLGPKSKKPYSAVKAMTTDGNIVYALSDLCRNTCVS
jgi:ion channel-forming bestrophin family protein